MYFASSAIVLLLRTNERGRTAEEEEEAARTTLRWARIMEERTDIVLEMFFLPVTRSCE